MRALAEDTEATTGGVLVGDFLWVNNGGGKGGVMRQHGFIPLRAEESRVETGNWAVFPNGLHHPTWKTAKTLSSGVSERLHSSPTVHVPGLGVRVFLGVEAANF